VSVDRFWCAGLNNFPFVHQKDAIRHYHRFFLVMSHKDGS
ncbi:hypothetical protein D021_0212B, partial [Vibrio parahaemolyticus 10296]